MQTLWRDFLRLYQVLRAQGPLLTVIAGLDKLIRWVTGRPSYRFGWITPHILLGGQPTEKVWPRLMARGITGVINLRQEYDYQAILGKLPLRYLFLPTLDNTAPTQAHIMLGVKFMQEEIQKGGKVYVHCWEGLGRSPTLVAAYLVSTGMTPKDAWATILKVRPFIRPTADQKARLDEFAAQLTASLAASGTDTSPQPTLSSG